MTPERELVQSHRPSPQNHPASPGLRELYQQDDGEEAVKHVAEIGQISTQAQGKHLEEQLQQVVQDEDTVENLKGQKRQKRCRC
jgi:hypothetical protein